MANLLEKIIVYSAATVFMGCAATKLNIKPEDRRFSPKFAYEQIENNKPQSYSTYCPNGFVDPLTGICISLEPFLGPIASNYKPDCVHFLPIWKESPFPNDSFPQLPPKPFPPFIPGEASYTDSADEVSVNKQPLCCCPPGVELPCCKITLRGRG